MNKSKIEWCDYTWNPVTGCLHECEYCYARGISQRFAGYWSEEQLKHLGANGEVHDIREAMQRHTTGKNRSVPVHCVQAAYPFGFDPTFHRYRLDEPAQKKKPQNIFVCSMADLFGDWVPDEWIQEVFKACGAAPQHRYLFLTKNPKRHLKLGPKSLLLEGDNYWYGTTVPTPDTEYFYNDNANTFLSIEPILAPFEFRGGGDMRTDWVIVGAETGNRKDKVIPKREWIVKIVNQCRASNVPVFMKNSLADVWGEPLIQEFPWSEVPGRCDGDR